MNLKLFIALACTCLLSACTYLGSNRLEEDDKERKRDLTAAAYARLPEIDTAKMPLLPPLSNLNMDRRCMGPTRVSRDNYEILGSSIGWATDGLLVDRGGKGRTFERQAFAASHRHDGCYAHGMTTYGYSRLSCDKKMMQDIIRICAGAYGVKEVEGQKVGEMTPGGNKCLERGATVYATIATLGWSFYGNNVQNLCDYDYGVHPARDQIVVGNFIADRAQRDFDEIAIISPSMADESCLAISLAGPAVRNEAVRTICLKDIPLAGAACGGSDGKCTLGKLGLNARDFLQKAPVRIDIDGDKQDEVVVFAFHRAEPRKAPFGLGMIMMPLRLDGAAETSPIAYVTSFDGDLSPHATKGLFWTTRVDPHLESKNLWRGYNDERYLLDQWEAYLHPFHVGRVLPSGELAAVEFAVPGEQLILPSLHADLRRDESNHLISSDTYTRTPGTIEVRTFWFDIRSEREVLRGTRSWTVSDGQPETCPATQKENIKDYKLSKREPSQKELYKRFHYPAGFTSAANGRNAELSFTYRDRCDEDLMRTLTMVWKAVPVRIDVCDVQTERGSADNWMVFWTSPPNGRPYPKPCVKKSDDFQNSNSLIMNDPTPVWFNRFGRQFGPWVTMRVADDAIWLSAWDSNCGIGLLGERSRRYCPDFHLPHQNENLATGYTIRLGAVLAPHDGMERRDNKVLQPQELALIPVAKRADGQAFVEQQSQSWLVYPQLQGNFGPGGSPAVAFFRLPDKASSRLDMLLVTCLGSAKSCTNSEVDWQAVEQSCRLDHNDLRGEKTVARLLKYSPMVQVGSRSSERMGSQIWIVARNSANPLSAANDNVVDYIVLRPNKQTGNWGWANAAGTKGGDCQPGNSQWHVRQIGPLKGKETAALVSH